MNAHQLGNIRWLTFYGSIKIVKQLRKKGHEIFDAHLAKISPLMYKHVIVNGTYDFSPSRRLSVVTR